MGDAIDQIAAAIDQLAQDLQVNEETSQAGYAARVADIWLMITAVDPELGRLMRRYTAPADPADGAGVEPDTHR